MKSYRIREYLGKFDIEIKVVKTKGHLWWKRDIIEWCQTDEFGGKWSYVFARMFPTSIVKMSKSFNTMREAIEQIEKWETKPIYRDVDGSIL